MEVHTDTPTEFELGNKAANIKSRRKEREQREGEEAENQQREGRRGQKPGGRKLYRHRRQ